jgi:hydroxylysine kinase
MSSAQELLRKVRKPALDDDSVKSILFTYWKLEVSNIKQLDSYDDCNYYIETTCQSTPIKHRYILKVYNGAEDDNTIRGFEYLFSWINKQQLSYSLPTIIETINNSSVEYIESTTGDFHYGVRLFDWIEGRTLNNIANSYDSFVQVGEMLGKVTLALQGFMHTSFTRIHAWDLKQFNGITPFIVSVEEEWIRDIITRVHQEFIHQVLPDSSSFRYSCIHGDANDANIIVNEEMNVMGLIDFGDSVYTWTVNDIATCMCYALLSTYGKTERHLVLKALFISYSTIFPLLSIEMKHLRMLICMRLSLSIAIGAYSISQNPTDEYLKLHAIPAKEALQFVWALQPTYFDQFSV